MPFGDVTLWARLNYCTSNKHSKNFNNISTDVIAERQSRANEPLDSGTCIIISRIYGNNMRKLRCYKCTFSINIIIQSTTD
jgi:hypothetical protein